MIGNLLNYLFVEPWPFWAGGVGIGLLVPLLYYFYNTPLGVSTGYGNLVKIIFGARHLRWIKFQFAETWSWRVYFIVGIILGAFLAARLAGRPLITPEMGQFTAVVEWPVLLTALYFFAGGILLGLGARIAGEDAPPGTVFMVSPICTSPVSLPPSSFWQAGWLRQILCVYSCLEVDRDDG